MRDTERHAVDRIAATRAFFGPRAAGWQERFPDDGPAYVRAVDELAPPPGGRVLDAGCGSGRALPALRDAVGPDGTVLGLDITPQMLQAAAQHSRDVRAGLVLADVLALPLADGALDAVFAAGLVAHLPSPVDGLRELARVCRPGGRLALFHPVGRAALAERQGRVLSEDDVRAPHNITPALATAGWRIDILDDAADRYLVVATRA